jgi:hypothetical protein
MRFCWKKVRVMNDSFESKLPDADMQAVPRALLRAAKRAREIARLTNTPLVLVRNGVRVEQLVDEMTDDPRDNFKELLEQMPEVGSDEDFARSDDRGRPVNLE